MLVNLPDNICLIPEAGEIQLAEGIYTGIFSRDIEHLVVNEHPFSPTRDMDVDARLKMIMDQVHNGTAHDYGVADTFEQITQRWPELETDPRSFVILVREITRDDQPDRGGWRWHKWGDYIGTHSPRHEYLADEPDIESVITFHIVEVRA